jgi:hypothetical protein
VPGLKVPLLSMLRIVNAFSGLETNLKIICLQCVEAFS